MMKDSKDALVVDHDDRCQGAALTILQLTAIAQSALVRIVVFTTGLSLPLRVCSTRLLRLVLQRLAAANRQYGHREPDSTANRTGPMVHTGRKIATSSEEKSRNL